MADERDIVERLNDPATEGLWLPGEEREGESLLADATARIRELEAKNRSQAATIERLEADRDRLAALVDRLPVTKDGVRIFLHDNIAAPLGGAYLMAGFILFECESDGEVWGTVRSGDGSQWRCRVSDCYSSMGAVALAAEAAAGGES